MFYKTKPCTQPLFEVDTFLGSLNLSSPVSASLKMEGCSYIVIVPYIVFRNLEHR